MKNKLNIFITIGPSTLNKNFLNFLQKKKNIVSLIRLNLSHIEFNDLEQQISFIRRYTNIPICLDTEGAQIRTKIKKKIYIKKNKIIYFNKSNKKFNFYPDNILNQLKKDDLLSIGFEGLKIKAVSVKKNYIKFKSLEAGLLENNKAVHLISRNIKLKFLTDKDIMCINLGKKLKINHYALSFTNTISDIKKFNKIIPFSNKIYKVETKNALNNFKFFLKYGNQFLIDRGDLSKSIKIENIPLAQRRILNLSKKKSGTRIAVATNFLESMIEKPFPTRAEINDIFNALELGASTLVLAAETAIGKNPKESVLLLERMIKIFIRSKVNKL